LWGLASATSSSTFFRQIGGTLGVAVIFSVLFGRIPATIASAFAEPRLAANVQAALADPAVLADPNNKQIITLLQGSSTSIGDSLNGDTAFLTTADHRLAAPFLHGFADATVAVFWVSLAVILVAFVLSFFLKATPLREKSALQEVADADAALLATQSAEAMGAQVAPQPTGVDSTETDGKSSGGRPLDK
jgi:hypothetical protein